MNKFLSGKLSSKGQLTIPSELREQWGMQEGDRLSFELDDVGNVASVSPFKKRTIKDLFGVVKTDSKLDITEAREAYQKNAANKIMSEIDGDNK